MGYDKPNRVDFRLRQDPLRDLPEALHIHKQERPLAPQLLRSSSGDGNTTRNPQSECTLRLL